MRCVELDQNSGAWLEWRKTGVGSSDAPALLGVSPWKSARELWEEKVYHVHRGNPPLSQAQLRAIAAKMAEKESQNESAKNRGKRLEPRARELYEAFLGFETPPVCGVSERYDFLKVSLDGWHEDRRHFVEIKAPGRSSHEGALAGEIPDHYVPQLWHQFLTSGALSCHYVSYHDQFPPGQRLVVIGKRREDYQGDLDKFEPVVVSFWDSVLRAECPFD